MSSDSDSVASRALGIIEQGQLLSAERILMAELGRDPASQSLRAARAMYHFRNGDSALALELAEEIAAEGAISRISGPPVAHILQDACRWRSLASVLERLIAVAPNDPQTLENLILTYVRLGRFSEVQKRAMALFRLGNNPLHQIWAVMANLFIAPQDDPSHLLLKIAAKMLDAQILKTTLTTQTCMMYFGVLLRQKLFNEAETFLLSTRGQMAGVLPVRLEALYKLKQQTSDWVSCCAIGLFLWRVDIDNWTYFEMYLSGLQRIIQDPQLVDTKPAAPGFTMEEDPSAKVCDTAHYSYAEAEAFVADWIANDLVNGRSRASLRGPYLAQLQLHLLQGKDVAPFIPQFLTLFSTKPCCVFDLLKFAAQLATPMWRGHLPENLASCSSLQDHLRYILRLKLDLLLPFVSEQEAQSQFALSIAGYHAALPLSKDLAWSEEGLCDGYIIVALNVALRRYADCADRRWLVLGLAALAHCERWLNNTAWLMFSVLFHRLLGLCDLAALRQLDFKSIQFESMEHIGFATLLQTGMFSAAFDMSQKCSHFYASLSKDIPLQRVKVFHYVSYSKLQEIEQFTSKLANSIGRLEALVYSIVLGLGSCETKRDITELLCSKTEALRAAMAVADEEMVCNEDYDVIASIVVGDFGSETHRRLVEALVSAVPLGRRISRARVLLAGCIACHDLCQMHRAEQAEAQQSASKMKSGKKGKATAFPIILPPKILLAGSTDLAAMLSLHGPRAAAAEDSAIWAWCAGIFSHWLEIARAVTATTGESSDAESACRAMSNLFASVPVSIGAFYAHLRLPLAMISILRSLGQCVVLKSALSGWTVAVLSALEAEKTPFPPLDDAALPAEGDFCPPLSRDKIVEALLAKHREKEHAHQSQLNSLLAECRMLVKTARKE